MFQPRNTSFGILLLTLAAPLPAQEGARDWARECDVGDRRSESHCEVREYTLRASGALRVDAHPNGGIRVSAWDRNEVKVVARVAAWARTAAAARELAGEVRVETDDREVRTTGPDTRNRSGWYVSYDIWAPARTDLRLSSTNGGLTVEGIHGRLDLATTNGGIHLRAVGGDVTAETTNGGIEVVLEGRRWEGQGLRAETTNGGVRLTVPDGYHADVEAATVHGGMDFDFPITLRGRINRRISTRLGDGGALISLETTNGGVVVRRR